MSIADCNQSDDQLLLQLEQGSKDAFNRLYEKYWVQTYAAGYRRLKNADQARDIVQDIFLHIWIKRENPIDNLPAYLNVAVRNRVFKQIEKEKATVPFLDILKNIPAKHQHADENILLNEFNNAYEALIASLPPKKQEIFRLRFHEDLTTKAIAGQLGLSRKTVQNQLGKAIKQLRISALHLFPF